MRDWMSDWREGICIQMSGSGYANRSFCEKQGEPQNR